MALKPGSVIGILGGGQLGRMLTLAAARLGFDVHIYAPEPDSPAASLARYETNGDYTDLEAIKAFAKRCDVVTYEFENVPAQTAAEAARFAPLRPGAKALQVAQDRLVEKTFLRDTAGVSVVDFEDVTNEYDIGRAGRKLGWPLILKTRRFGYDGKGQVKIDSEADVKSALAALKGSPAIVESFAPFAREVSVVAARSIGGGFAAFPLIENVHRNHILHKSTCPAPDMKGSEQAIKMSQKIMDSLDYVGVMATEFFQMENGDLIVNEIAPRVHNSGHFSQDSGCVDQFELHIRAICGWPLGNTQPRHQTIMTNLIGDDVKSWKKLAAFPNSHIHLYGKSEAREGRKMGHVNTIGPAVGGEGG